MRAWLLTGALLFTSIATAQGYPSKPVRLIAYANGRLTVLDPETGWSVELGDFGSDNKAAFERLMTK